jgi:hypothetical protein
MQPFRGAGLVTTMVGLLLARSAAAEPEKDLAYLMKNLAESPNSQVRARCAEDLGKRGPAAKPAARALCLAMFDRSPRVRAEAGRALEQVFPQLYAPIAFLLANPEREDLLKAIAAIGRLKKDGNAATPILLAHLQAIVTEHQILTQKDQLTKAVAASREQLASIREDDSLEMIYDRLCLRLFNKLQGPADESDLAGIHNRLALLPRLVRADHQSSTLKKAVGFGRNRGHGCSNGYSPSNG